MESRVCRAYASEGVLRMVTDEDCEALKVSTGHNFNYPSDFRDRNSIS